MTDETKTIWWNDENNSIMLIDQTKLPVEFSIIEVTTVERLAEAIRRLEVRGAPALGVAGAFGVALSAVSCVSDAEFAETVAADAELLRSTRPTAVNLSWGIDKVLRSMENLPPEMAKFLAITAAKNIAAEDEKCCMLLGHNGASLLPHLGNGSRCDPVGAQDGQEDLGCLLRNTTASSGCTADRMGTCAR